MTARDHYQQAQLLVEAANRRIAVDDSAWLNTPERRAELRADAAVHATLALTTAICDLVRELARHA